MTTLLEIAKHNGSDALVGLIEEAVHALPELQIAPARTIRGRQFKTLVRTRLPTVGFRAANEGVTPEGSMWENRLVETFILTPRFECDKAVADSHEDGWQQYMAVEAAGIMSATMLTLATQFFYGSDAKGFPGLAASLDDSMVIDAEGTTDNTASSVWAVRFGVRDVIWVWGMDGQLALSDVRVETLRDGNNKPFAGYVQDLTAYPGLMVGAKHSIGRIKNITEDAGSTLSDTLLAKLLTKFPAGLPPSAFFMSRRSLEQLRESRTATNPTGAPAPFPDSAFGIPIYVTDAISVTEALS